LAGPDGRLREEDRVFLHEFILRTCIAHPAAAVALYRASQDPEELAVAVESLMRSAEPDFARQIARASNTTATLRAQITAQLVAQLARAIEDCGALGDAIRFRHKGGLFRRYLSSRNDKVSEFLTSARGNAALPELLAIPALDDVPHEVRASLGPYYESLPTALRALGDIHSAEGVPKPGGVSPGDPGFEDGVVTIVTAVVSRSEDGQFHIPIATIADAYNKLKHRFAVVEDIRSLVQAVQGEGDSLVYAAYPTSVAFVERLVTGTVRVAQTSRLMAQLVLKLDEVGALTSP